MTSAIRLNHFAKEILISKTFQKAAMNPNSMEYKDLAEVMTAHPDYKITQRGIKECTHKDTYKGLTYEYMRDYIILTSTKEEEAKNVAEFNELVLISRCQSKNLRYPTIKKWFLAKYPEIAEFGIETVRKAQRETEPEE